VAEKWETSFPLLTPRKHHGCGIIRSDVGNYVVGNLKTVSFSELNAKFKTTLVALLGIFLENFQ